MQKEKMNTLVLQELKTHSHLRETLSVKFEIEYYCDFDII